MLNFAPFFIFQKLLGYLFPLLHYTDLKIFKKGGMLNWLQCLQTCFLRKNNWFFVLKDINNSKISKLSEKVLKKFLHSFLFENFVLFFLLVSNCQRMFLMFLLVDCRRSRLWRYKEHKRSLPSYFFSYLLQCFQAFVYASPQKTNFPKQVKNWN